MIKNSFVTTNPELRENHKHLLDGIKHFSGDDRQNELELNRLAVMLENAEMDGCSRLSMSRQQLRESQTSTASSVSFVKNQLPIIRKVFSSLIARELVSVQPMAQPETKVFYYDIKRDDGTSMNADSYNKRTFSNNVEYNPDSPTAIKEINLEITGSSLSATEKKLKAKWTIEAQQDIFAYHGIDVQQDLTAALATNITREWDYTIIYAMLNGATGGAATFDQTVPSGITYTDRKVWMEGLFEKMIDVDTSIFKKTLRKTNWLVVPPEVSGFMDKLSTFKLENSNPTNQVIASGGRYYTGTLSNRWRVYVDPFIPSDKILMGFNNPGDWLDTAVVFSPYIMAYFSEVFMDPNTQQSVRSILSRAGLFLARPDLLGTVTISGS